MNSNETLSLRSVLAFVKSVALVSLRQLASFAAAQRTKLAAFFPRFASPLLRLRANLMEFFAAASVFFASEQCGLVFIIYHRSHSHTT